MQKSHNLKEFNIFPRHQHFARLDVRLMSLEDEDNSLHLGVETNDLLYKCL